MRSEALKNILDGTPEDVKIFARLYGDLVVRINSILKEKGLTRKGLANKLEKSPSEIHKWLGGSHNFTLRSIAKLQAELGEELLYVPKKISTAQFIQGKPATVSMTVFKNEIAPCLKQRFEWTTDQPIANGI